MGHDIVEVPKYWRQVFENGGLNVQGNVGGHRGDEPRAARRDGRLKSIRGGKRVKNAVEAEVWLHPDARAAMDIFFEAEEEKYSVVLQRLQDNHSEMTLPKRPAMDMVDIGGGNPPPSNSDDNDDSTHGSVCSDVSSDDEEE